jgi:hypothetical protein
MTRECQVRFCEGLGVKSPGATRQVTTEAVPHAVYEVEFVIDLLSLVVPSQSDQLDQNRDKDDRDSRKRADPAEDEDDY